MNVSTVSKPKFLKKSEHRGIVEIGIYLKTPESKRPCVILDGIYENTSHPLPLYLLTDRQPMNHYIPVIRKPLAVKMLVSRLSCEDNSGITNDSPFIFQYISDTFFYIGTYMLFVGIVLVPLLLTFGKHTLYSLFQYSGYFRYIGSDGVPEYQ